MKQARAYLLNNFAKILIALTAAGVLCAVYIYKLGSLVNGISFHEAESAQQIVGWHGIVHDPLFLPLKVVRSIVFYLSADHGQTLTRLPNVAFGLFAVFSFVLLIKLWHGLRTALFAGLLFALSAWTLHNARLASFDVLYLWATPTLLLTHVLATKYSRRAVVVFGSILIWGLSLYIPGLVWLVIPLIYVKRSMFTQYWSDKRKVWQRLLLMLAVLIWLPLLVYRIATSAAFARQWLGLPDHFSNLHQIMKDFVAVPVHLFIRGPEYPNLWIGKLPIFDIFTLTVLGLGIYFYLRHWRNSRARLLLLFAVTGVILVGLHGAVSISLLVSLGYIFAAMGLTFLLHEWLKVFPTNPLARALGILLIAIAVALSCVFNIRAYFVAWPHSTNTKATFQYHR